MSIKSLRSIFCFFCEDLYDPKEKCRDGCADTNIGKWAQVVQKNVTRDRNVQAQNDLREDDQEVARDDLVLLHRILFIEIRVTLRFAAFG